MYVVELLYFLYFAATAPVFIVRSSPNEVLFECDFFVVTHCNKCGALWALRVSPRRVKVLTGEETSGTLMVRLVQQRCSQQHAFLATDGQTNEQTNRQPEGHRHRIKPPFLRREFNPLIATLKPQSNEPSYSTSDWYTGRLWVGCYIWYGEEGPGRAAVA